MDPSEVIVLTTSIVVVVLFFAIYIWALAALMRSPSFQRFVYKAFGVRPRAREKIPLEDKLKEVAKLSSQLSDLNSEIGDEFRVQLAETQRLQSEAATAQQIAALNREALEAAESLVASQMQRALNRSAKADRVFQIIVAIVSFVAGIGATLVLQSVNAG